MAPLFSLLKPHSWASSAPIFPLATSRNDEPAIPDPAVFTTTPLAASGLPTVSQCAVHLELLQALSRLRDRVTKESALIKVFGTVEEEQETWWRAFVEIAVGRFEVWWWGVDEELRRRQQGSGVGGGELPEDLLPPLDVVMVWHSYMLNPRCYNEDALHFGLHHILRTAFPWAQIHAALDGEKFEYKLPEPATQFFEKLSSQSSSLIDELLRKDVALKKRLRCFHCGKEDVDVRMCDSEKLGHGWMDDAFAVNCGGCGAVINKEGLCTAKFESDVEVFLKAGAEGRMRMTNFDSHGHAYPTDASSATWEPATFINTFFRDPSTPRDLRTLNAALPNTLYLPSLRLCLAAYTTPSPFSLDLAAAVHRQGVFGSKMADQLWLRSPGLIGTLPASAISTVRARARSCVLIESPSSSDGFLARAITRYERFFALFHAHPGHTLVPTLDVDLVWHSAMLTPELYRAWCRTTAGRFVGHDDSLGEGVLGDAFVFTEEAYKSAYGRAYGRCCCWFCEAAANEGLQRDGEGGRRWVWPWRRGEEKAVRGVRVRVEFYREVERKRRAGSVGLARTGLFEALKRC